MLLYQGIGDTIRVSLSDDSVDEVIAGYEILKALNLRSKGAVLAACPSCGRAVIFRKGEKVRVVPEAEMLTALMEEVEAEPVSAGD